MTNPTQLDHLEELLAKATSLPWEATERHDYREIIGPRDNANWYGRKGVWAVVYCDTDRAEDEQDANATLIAEATTALPSLIADLRAMRGGFGADRPRKASGHLQHHEGGALRTHRAGEGYRPPRPHDGESGSRWERPMTTPTKAENPNDPTAIAKDAARYRWLRDHSCPPHNFYISVPDEFHGVRYTPSEVDAYIDAANAALLAQRSKTND